MRTQTSCFLLLGLVLLLLHPAAALGQPKGCSLTASISADPPDTARAGELVTLAPTISDGEAPYQVAWDLNGDGELDAATAPLETRFTQAGPVTLSLSVTDAGGCSTSAELPLQVLAPAISLEESGPAVERCGDGDGRLEPGETGALTVTLSNLSDEPAEDVVAIFGRGRAAGAAGRKLTAGPDQFGYTLADDFEASCRSDFLDISETGQRLTYEGLSPGDESAARVELDGPGVTVYGQPVTALAMSSNGYLALNPEDRGEDLRPVCPQPAAPSIGPNDGRLLVYHDDLTQRTTGGAYYQYFGECPRPPDRGAGQPCHVFQWQAYDFGTGGPQGPGPRPESDFDFQAVIYEGSGDLVYQYRGDNPTQGANAAVGLLAPAAADGLSYACEERRVAPGRSVCFFAPEATSSRPFSRQGLRLETPALALGDLAPGASVTTQLEFALEPDAECGTRTGFDYLGATFAGGFSNTAALDSAGFAIGDAAGGCASSAVCSFGPAVEIPPEPGLLFDPTRPGNGVDMQVVGSNLALLWYTADADHYPHWYFVAGPYGDNQVETSILDFSFAGTFTASDPSFRTAGSAWLTWLNPEEMIYVWELDGQRWGERLQVFRTSTDPTDLEVTAQYFNPAENGWGIAVNRQGTVEVQTLYLYDEAGRPVWLLSRPTDADGRSDLDGFRWVHCPGCPWVAPLSAPAGSLQRQFEGAGTGVLDTMIALPDPMAGTWDRTDLPIQKIN